MSKMKVAIISCFETYQNRIDDMEKYYQSRNFEVTIIKSNFLHFKKTKVDRNSIKDNEISIEVPAYTKNISFKRIFSHYKFARKCANIIENHSFDLLHVLLPPNYLCKVISELTCKPKVIYDIIDFWPETMPINKISRLRLYKSWQSLRNEYIGNADYILAECDLFKDRLNTLKPNLKIKTIYFTRKDIKKKIQISKNITDINIVYLGSVNNIIDIDLIVTILIKVHKKKRVVFHLIGDGEKKDKLIVLLQQNRIDYIDYGAVYNLNKKKEILSKCAFALNIMKQNVFVGLTMKSLDYFQYGVPIINNIKYDTEQLVNEFDVGINTYENKDVESLANEIIAKSEYVENNKLRRNVDKMFKEIFLFEGLEKKMDLIMNQLKGDI